MGSYDLTHPVNVAILSLALARTVQLSKREQQSVGIAALLHDVGQLDVPGDLLSGNAELSQEAWASMRQHTIHGAARLLEAGPLELVAPAALAALEHHMGASSGGYPQVPAENAPDLVSRIVHIADTYDALTSRRVYRQCSVHPDRALAFLLQYAGDKFDPLLVKLFVHTLGFYPPGTTIRLDTDEVGVVVRPNRHPKLLHRPRVCLMLNAKGEPVERDTFVDLDEVEGSSEDYVHSVGQTLDPEPLGISPTALFLAGE
ncbi:MAG: HD-GYP domain-containing protein, partial [Candidatus Krumholzibacteriia bacterium]